MSRVLITRHGEGVAYDPPGHDGVDAKRLHGVETDGPEAFWVARSTYPPGASATMSPTAGDTVYVVTRGELVVSEETQDHVLRAGDSAYIAAGGKRAVENRSADIAELIVVLAPSDS